MLANVKPRLKEEYLLRDGQGLIEISVSQYTSSLKIRGDVIAFNEPTGSDIVQKLTRASISDFEEITKQQEYVREVAQGHFYEHCSIQSQISNFLTLFVNGTYELSYFQNSDMDYLLLDYEESWTSVAQSFEYYPYPFNFVFTQPSEMLNANVINHYAESIERGLFPIVFTTNIKQGDYYGYCDYIIDGHSKLMAYENYGQIPTAFIRISRVISSE